MTDNLKGVARLNLLENDKFQEGLFRYPDFFRLTDDIIHSLSREFVDTVRNENNVFLTFLHRSVHICNWLYCKHCDSMMFSMPNASPCVGGPAACGICHYF